MAMAMRPDKPCKSAVPESGTTVTVNCATPRFMMPVCCRTNVPRRPCSVPFNPLQCDVAGRTLDSGASREHVTPARGLEITAEAFVDRHTAKRGLFARPGFLRTQLHLERSTRTVHECLDPQ